MKKFFIAGAFALSTAQMAQASTPKFWINEPEKIVVMAANPSLDVKLTNLNLEGDHYAILEVDLQFKGKDIASQFASVMKDYPNYREQRAVLQAEGAYRYRIPILNIDQEVRPMNGVEGPYVTMPHYLSKPQYVALREAIKKGVSVIEISGTNSGTVPVMKVVERRELDPSVCSRIIGRDQTVGSIISNTAMVNQAAAEASFEYDSTRIALVSDIKANCFELGNSARVHSFSDVMNLQVKAKNPGRNLVGETMKRTNSKELVPVVYDLKQELGAQ